MALTENLSDTAADIAAGAVLAALDGGYLRIFDGTQPATADTAVTTQIVLVEIVLGSPAFTTNGDGTANINPSTSGTSVAGTASWFRAYSSDGVTAIIDGSVGTSGCNLNMNTITFVLSGTVTADTWVYTQSKT